MDSINQVAGAIFTMIGLLVFLFGSAFAITFGVRLAINLLTQR